MDFFAKMDRRLVPLAEKRPFFTIIVIQELTSTPECAIFYATRFPIGKTGHPLPSGNGREWGERSLCYIKWRLATSSPEGGGADGTLEETSALCRTGYFLSFHFSRKGLLTARVGA